MHSMDNYCVSKLIPLMAEAQIHVASNPCVNITCRAVLTPTPNAGPDRACSN